MRTPEGALRVVFGLSVLYRVLWQFAATAIPPGNDANRYLISAFSEHGLFSDFAAPSGYPLFLKLVGNLPDKSLAIPLVQQALGLLTAYFVWLVGRRIADRLEISRWWPMIGAAFVALNGDLGFYSQAIMTEDLSIVLMLPVIVLAERVTARRLTLRQIALFGLCIGLLVGAGQCVRTVAGPTLAVLLLLTLIWVRGIRQRVVAVLTVGIGVAIVMSAYLTAVDASQGKKSGLGGMEGWYLYARAASFSDCRKMDPPAKLRDLCIDTPVDQRPGGFAYVYYFPNFSVQTPAVRKYVNHPNGNADLEAFGLRAITHQPLDYVSTILHDLGRYVAPDAGSIPPYSGPGPEFEEITNLPGRNVSDEALHGLGVTSYKARPLAGLMEAWNNISRFPPLLQLLFALAPLLGVWRLRRSEYASTIVPIWLTALASATIPILVGSYEYRYGLPAQVMLAIIGPLTIGALIRSYRGRSEPAG